MALKVYSLDRVPANLVHTLVREVRIHAELSHRAVLTLYGVFQEASRLVLVLERAARGDLYQVHRRMLGSRMSEAQLAGVVLAPLLDALVYLHARGVCHRDIKVWLQDNFLGWASRPQVNDSWSPVVARVKPDGSNRTHTLNDPVPKLLYGVSRAPFLMAC